MAVIGLTVNNGRLYLSGQRFRGIGLNWGSAVVRIYSQGGKLIREIQGPGDVSGTTMGWNRVEWDGHDKNGKAVSNDVYFYTVDARFNDGVKKSIRGKCVKAK